jgi:hypothetical protein
LEEIEFDKVIWKRAKELAKSREENMKMHQVKA